ncbi:ATP-binding protein [Cryptococcus gattii E566]|uniref:Ribokinase n=2 Tax=Cryptococcus gattii TaxID=37769 RepID=E6R705_CRYGW|nr:ATP binding protein, putative [Cryptococcus gattii WM276]ADV22485.1 ATP binding protein, putative [Cryptococcus gattii WM276]KIR78573.1 ATP-binding protein [Cryptococcus gattii EJB2]KIY34753.1 ATP-binding protein [Cryptococcus gattii E566]KJE00751.1 ATP-binding protein [Cryptococcus gattii NT-10]
MSMDILSLMLTTNTVDIDEFFHLPHIVRPGETISSTGLTKRAGGKGANQAFAVARAGGQVELDGAIGDDGMWVKEILESAGVGTDKLKVVKDEVTGRAVIQILHAGANYYLPSSTPAPSLSTYTHLLVQNEVPLSSTLAYLTAAGQSSPPLTSVFNPSPMLTPSQLREFPWKHLSWLIVNEGELGDLLLAFGSSANPGEAKADELQARASAGILELHENEYFSKNVGIICTLGAKGILYYEPGKEVGYLPAAKLQNPVKDTTGAGDCFAGYFVAGLMSGKSLQDALKACLVACGICVENEGAMESVPTLEAVNKRLA